MAKKCIGILDSGFGGLSVLKEIHKLLPEQSLLYVADSAWCPYGNKTSQQIRERVCKIADYLIREGAELIVIACNSATITCVEYLRTLYPVPIVGMEPGVKPAAGITKTGKIGVFATEASLAGEKFNRLVSNHAEDIHVITQPCPKFVTLVESGNTNTPEAKEIIRNYTEPMLEAGVDTIVLGCTHYPFLKDSITTLYPKLQLIDTGAAVARQVERRLPSALTLVKEKQSFQLLTSGEPEKSSSILSALCHELKENNFSQLPL